MGVFSSTGKNRNSFFENLLQCRSGVGPISQFDSSALTVKIAAEVAGYNADDYFPAKRQDLLDKFAQFALIAAGEAMESSGLTVREEERCRFGVVMGSGMGGAGSYDAGYHNLYAKRANAATSHICMEFGAQGPALATATACSSSGHAISEAFHMIKYGMADMMLAGGADAPITYGVMRCWEAVRVLASGNGNPAAACRPFSADRKGMVIGEGSGVLLLEELDHALKRGANIYGEMAGCGMSSDASHITQPSVDGPVRAIRMALDEAGVAPDEIDYINAHGTGTRLNDATETQVVKEVFNHHAKNLAISSTKSMHGHAMGATGAIEFVATVLAVKNGVVPPTANYTQPDPECDLDYVPNQAREKRIRAALSNSFAFGGLNAVLLVRHWN
jgi:beta-ketoacyl-acyl-carrier-protein synthase II